MSRPQRCGSITPADPGESRDDGYTQKILSKNVFYPEASEDVFAKYREFGFEWTEGDAFAVDTWSIHYLYEGTEEVNGEAAEAYTVTFVQSGETYVEKHWYNALWDCIKVMSGGQEVEWWFVFLPTQIYIYVDMVLDAQLVFDQDGCIDPGLQFRNSCCAVILPRTCLQKKCIRCA